MSLRPAVPGRHGHRPHRYEAVAPRGVHARIDGEWTAAALTGRMQPHDGGRWEICLEYAQAPGQNVVGWFVEDEAHLRGDERVDDAAKQGPPKIDQVPDANIPADLLALKRARIRATAALKALPPDAPSEERQQARAAEMAAFQAMMAHPAYHATPWVALEAAAREDEPGSDRSD